MIKKIVKEVKKDELEQHKYMYIGSKIYEDYCENFIDDDFLVITNVDLKDEMFFENTIFSTRLIKTVMNMYVPQKITTKNNLKNMLNTYLTFNKSVIKTIKLPLFKDSKYSLSCKEQINYELSNKTAYIENFKRNENYTIETDGVSIVVVMFRYKDSMIECLKSIFEQNYDTYEVIIINNNHTNNVYYEKVNNLISRFDENNIKIVDTNAEVNANVARNLGVDNSKYDYIKFFDDDDIMYPDLLKELVKLQKKEQTVVTFCSDRKQKSEIMSAAKIYTGDFSQLLWNKIWDVLPSTSNSLFVKEVLIKEGKWDEKYDRHQDYELFIRLARKYDFSRINIKLLNYEFDGSKVTPEFLELVDRMMRKIYNDYGDDIHNYSFAGIKEINNMLKRHKIKN